MRSGVEKIVLIGRHDVSSFMLVCLIQAQVLLQAAVDILEKQGALVADRPRMIAGGEMLFGGLMIIFAHIGDRFRRMRKFVVTILHTYSPTYISMWCRTLHTHLQPKAAEVYQPLQMSHAKNTVLSLLSSPYFQDHATV
jgi:hypothetical protein